MTFKPGDQVIVEGKGPYIVQSGPSLTYPLVVNENSYTAEGRYRENGPVRLVPFYPDSITSYPLGKVQTLDNGIQIYHPNEGQPFQLTSSTKALL